MNTIINIKRGMMSEKIRQKSYSKDFLQFRKLGGKVLSGGWIYSYLVFNNKINCMVITGSEYYG